MIVSLLRGSSFCGRKLLEKSPNFRHVAGAAEIDDRFPGLRSLALEVQVGALKSCAVERGGRGHQDAQQLHQGRDITSCKFF